MVFVVFLAVLAAAACHAGWNTLLKLNLEPAAATTLMATASGLIALPLAMIFGPPAQAAWPYLVATVVIHVAYFLALAEAYRIGDLGQVYPIARGTAPLMTAVIAAVWLAEQPSSFAWAGIVMLAAGILLLAVWGGRRTKRFDARSVGFALLTSLTITAYTLVDGLGARAAGNPIVYTIWLFLLSGAAMAAYGYLRMGSRLTALAKAHWPITLAGSSLSVAAYGVVIWAMTVAPIALVAALRETSVLFGALFATLILREPLIATRAVVAVVVLTGALLLRM
jgi:drug/metabolite transporter (DMT)-like permease